MNKTPLEWLRRPSIGICIGVTKNRRQLRPKMAAAAYRPAGAGLINQSASLSGAGSRTPEPLPLALSLIHI